MKHFIAILFLSFLSNSLYGQSSSIATVEIKTNISCDHCLRCGSCAPRIQKAVRINKGIKSVNIDADQDIITVKFNTDKTDATSIRESVTDAGFDADDLKAKPEAYKKLDACCKAPERSGGK